MNLVYYSLSSSANRSYDRQWIESIRSLRRFNLELPVCLLVYDGVSEEVLREAACHDVMVAHLGSYRDRLCRTSKHGAVLSLYPTLHKFLSLSELDTLQCSQILYVDCDTFFFADPAHLFSTYREHHWYAREAPTSRRCPHGYNPVNIDEGVLEQIATQEGLRPILPFNSGVCLLNHGVWRDFGDLGARFLDNMWRLLVGRHQRASDGSDQAIRRAVLASATDSDRVRALPYPSRNFWIAEEIALWLTLAGIPGLSQGFLSSEHILQGEEFEHAQLGAGRPVLAHYFSSLQDRFFSSAAYAEA